MTNGRKWVAVPSMPGKRKLRVELGQSECEDIRTFWNELKEDFQNLLSDEELNKVQALSNGCRPVGGIVEIEITEKRTT